MRDQSAGHRRRHGYPGDHPRGGRWRHLSAVRKAAYGCGAFLTVIVVVASLGAYIVYRHLTGNIKVVSVSGLTHRSVYGAQARQRQARPREARPGRARQWFRQRQWRLRQPCVRAEPQRRIQHLLRPARLEPRLRQPALMGWLWPRPAVRR